MTVLPSAMAQQSSPSTAPPSPGVVPSDSFIYSALRRLGQEGLIEGYPRGTDVVQGRILTRIEAATLAGRLITRLENLADLPNGQRPVLHADDLRLAQRLIEELRSELATIGIDLKRAAQYLPQIAALSDEPLDPAAVHEAQLHIGQILVDRERTGDERTMLNRLQQRVSGYFQFRYDSLVGDDSLFRSPGGGGTGQRPTTGGPAVGGPRSGFAIRRGRVKISDRFTPRDEFSFQVDLPSNAAPNIRDAFIRVLNFPAKNFAFRAGQYAFPYGFEYVYSSRYRETPERALGFSDSTQASFIYKTSVAATGGVLTPGTVLPFFLDQDRDIGVELSWAHPGPKGRINPRASFNILQGEGRAGTGQRSLNNVYDIMASVEGIQQQANGSEFSFGASFYDGALSVRSGPPTGEGDTQTLASFRNADRTFGGAYIRYRRGVQEYRAEYSGGKYEVTPDRSQLLPGNRFNAWYVVTRQPLARALEGYIKYDEFHPLKNGTVVGGVQGDDYARKTLQVGLLYNVTPATRFRLNYEQAFSPYDPSAAAGSPNRDKLGLIQIDVQQVF